ncbi:hypothetical protein FGO68_gene9752 [Halteria grandinella]|uniref:Uncharacterized protein n=1 Tax=Halteria grandinella TaxID=5974 RepID=A0A8J8NRM7_HALGN|nr:hypothetical protein FGO68_gene9752 [Halteria grandinella]
MSKKENNILSCSQFNLLHISFFSLKFHVNYRDLVRILGLGVELCSQNVLALFLILFLLQFKCRRFTCESISNLLEDPTFEHLIWKEAFDYLKDDLNYQLSIRSFLRKFHNPHLCVFPNIHVMHLFKICLSLHKCAIIVKLVLTQFSSWQPL